MEIAPFIWSSASVNLAGYKTRVQFILFVSTTSTITPIQSHQSELPVILKICGVLRDPKLVRAYRLQIVFGNSDYYFVAAQIRD
jgi:hypothetical protein